MKKKKQQKPESTISLNGGIISGGDASNFITTIGGTTTSTFINPVTRILKNTDVINNSDGTFIELTYEEIPYYQFNYTQKNIVKDIYGVKGGKLCIIKTIRGKEIPGYYVEPSIEWEE